MTWSHRHIGNPVLTGMLNVLFGLKSSDAHSGLRAFRREALQQLSLSCEGMELASEIVVKAARAGLEVAEVPIVYHPRTGESKLQSLPDAWRHMRFLLLLSPLHVFMWPGLLLFGAGLAAQGVLLGLGAFATWPALERPRRVRHAVGYAVTGPGLVRQDLCPPRRPGSGVAGQPLRGAGVHLERGLLVSVLLGLLGALMAAVLFFGVVGGKSLDEQLAELGLGARRPWARSSASARSSWRFFAPRSTAPACPRRSSWREGPAAAGR